MGWLFDNPLILFFLISWIVSLIGGAVQRSQKKQADQRRQARGSGPASPTNRQQDPQPSPKPSEAETIAAEIRRALGLEEDQAAERTTAAPRDRPPAPTPGPLPEPVPMARYEPPSEPVRVEVVPDRPHVTLVEQLRVKADADTARRLEADERRSRGSLRETHRLRDLKPKLAGVTGRPDRVARAHGQMLALARPASAFVAREVFGPPLALQDPRRVPFER